MFTTTHNNDNYCNQCKGECWKGLENNAATQEAARARFGITPNNCVISTLGGTKVSRCPYHTH